MERHDIMKKSVKKCAAIVCYLLLMSTFFEFQLGKLFDWKQFLIWLSGTGLLLLPSLGEKTEPETWGQKLQRMSQCGLWASFLESFLLCLAAMERVEGTEGLLPELALCLRPVLYGLCVWTVFVQRPEGEKKDWPEEGTSRTESAGSKIMREITVSESYVLFQKMGLTRRECEVGVLICQGMSNGEIAESLCISEATVKKHVSNIFEKLGCSRREQIRGKLFE